MKTKTKEDKEEKYVPPQKKREIIKWKKTKKDEKTHKTRQTKQRKSKQDHEKKKR